jgi:cation diffusion facilitator CzcD-associated flavoprotein CzcO
MLVPVVELPSRVRVAVVGAGFSGLGAAARLLRAGFDDLVVLERADAVGGTWRDNRYPGCACDVPSSLYSFSYAPEPGWTRRYAPWQEIRDYLERFTDRFGVRPHLALGTEVTRSAWDDEHRAWVVDTSKGRLLADVLVAGVGPLAEPALPDVQGLEGFAGTVLHTSRWDPSLDLAGRHVVVVGTGASSVQVVPEIVGRAASVVVLQRTAPWVLPRRDRGRPGWERRLYARVPLVQQLARGATYLSREANLPVFLHDGALRRVAETLARRHLARQVPDPALRALLTPGYRIGCKRVLLSDDWYPALQRPGVRLVAAGLAAVRSRSVVDAAGAEHPADVLVLGTGFHVTDLPAGETTYGRDGRSLAEVWAGSPQAYDGVTVAGFPNLFLLLGPGTGLGHSSVVAMAEAQVDYVVRALRTMRARGAGVLEVRPDRQAGYVADLRRRLAGTVWATGGCRSWYQDRTGEVSAVWPGGIGSYRRRLARFDPAAYALLPADGVAFTRLSASRATMPEWTAQDLETRGD